MSNTITISDFEVHLYRLTESYFKNEPEFQRHLFMDDVLNYFSYLDPTIKKGRKNDKEKKG